MRPAGVHFSRALFIVTGKGGDRREVAQMDSRGRNVAAQWRRDFSRRTLFFGIVCVAAFIIASLVDLDALLSYFKVIRQGAPMLTLETGAIVSMACAVPFLAMGMSISADSHEADRRRR